MNTTPDGDFQTYQAQSGGFGRQHSFGRDPRTLAMVDHLTDQEIWNLKRGGHDYGNLKSFRARLCLDIPDAALDEELPPYYWSPKSAELEYLHGRRRVLGGYLPERPVHGTPPVLTSDLAYAVARHGSGRQQVATTVAFVRLLKALMRGQRMGHRLVPIIPDEARTFGLDALFASKETYSPHGQTYLSVDREQMLSYQEDAAGVLLHEGITEAGSAASWTAAGTSYATHGEPMIPIYIFYSIASTNPACLAYDAAYAFELSHIVQHALRRMYGEPRDGEDPNVFYYLTLHNEPIRQPAQPDDVDIDGILAGMHRYAPAAGDGTRPRAQILASGVAVPWALAHPGQLRRVPHRLSQAPGPVVAVSDWMRAVPDQIAPFGPAWSSLGADGLGLSDDTIEATREVRRAQ